MMASPSPTLDFSTLDDLAFAAERGRLDGREIPHLKATDIGPIFELHQLAACKLLPYPKDASWLSLEALTSLIQAVEDGKKYWICPWSRRIGFLRTTSALPDEKTWISFGMVVQQAATRIGFARQVAAQLAAAVGELYSNIYEHSQAPETGIIAFRAHSDRFEFVVTDYGIGALESLRTAKEYEKLRDHGEALRLALADGVSRYGPDSGRGHGFRPLFIGLANLNGSLRFRSGDHALLINGQNPTLMTAQPAQKPSLKGLFISVSCGIASA